MIKYAQVGGHKTYLQSLDVRTLGVAGGSMIRVCDKKIVDVGPRSAHIAGMDYECFAPEGGITGGSIRQIAPRADDPCEYVILDDVSGRSYSYTLAGAANLLGYVPEEDYAHGVAASNEAAWAALGVWLGISGRDAARQVMDLAMAKLSSVVEELIAEYGLDRNFTTLVGGGGSGAVIVNALAEKMGVRCKMAKNAPYISTIGVALAMVREQMERTIANPTDEDIKRIRADVIEKIVRSGAKEETVDVAIEIDAQKNILRAIATGATELRQKSLGATELTREQLTQIAADSLGIAAKDVSYCAGTGRWNLFEGQTQKKLLGFIKLKSTAVAVLDREGVVRLRKEKGSFVTFTRAEQDSRFRRFLDENTTYSDANATIPKVFVFYKEKMLDLTGMQTAEQLYSILNVETEMLAPEEQLLAVAYK